MGLPITRFYLDDGTGTFPDDITPYVRLTDGFSFSRGRTDTQSAPTAGVLTLALNNKDGRFTPGSTILGTPSPIKLDQRIRVKETVNGVTYNRFTGYVKTWAVSWLDVTEPTCITRVTATDAQARAERRVLRSVAQEEIRADLPSRYYPMNEETTSPTGVTTVAAGDASGNQREPLQQAGAGTAVSFGGTLGTSATAAATFASSGKYLTSTSAVALIGATSPWFYTVAFATTMSGTAATLVGTPTDGTLLGLDSTGHLTSSAGAGITSSTIVNDGAPHVAAIYATSGTNNLYLDGVLVGSASQNWGFPNGLNFGQGFTGAMAHLASWGGTIPSVGDIAIQANAVLNGFAGESGTNRIARLAGYANISIGTLDASLTNVPAQDTAGRSAWDCIQEVCDAEMGVAYINGSGTLDFHNRQRVTVKTAPDLTLAGFVRPDAEPTTDDQDLLNYVEVSAVSTGAVQLVNDAASETSHGRYSDSKTFLVATDQEALDRGNWLVTTRAEPASSGRYGTLTVNLFGMSPAQQSTTLAALERGCWLRAAAMPSQTPGGTTADVVVEGISEAQSGDTWEIACNVVSKTTLYPKVFILDSSLLDGADLLGV